MRGTYSWKTQALLLARLPSSLKESPNTHSVQELLKKVDELMQELIAYIEENAKINVVPIDKMVKLQLDFLKITLKYI